MNTRSFLCYVIFAGLALGEACAGGLRGYVMGQDEKGAHLGPLAGARIDLLDKAGRPAATATTNRIGYYEIATLAAGNFTYRVKADGFMEENAGRGFTMPASPRPFVLDFVVSRGATIASPPAAGELSGRVWQQSGAGKQPIAGARVALQRRTGGVAQILQTAADGSYRVSLPPGAWRASAAAPGITLSLPPQAVVVPPGSKATLDFTFSRTDITSAGPRTNEVFVMVSVQRAETASRAGEAPQVQLFAEGSETALATTIRPLKPAELANLGLTPDSASKLWEWFIAQARDPLPEGRYVAKAQLADFRPGTSATEVVSAALSTYFDVALRPLRSAPATPPTEIVKMPAPTPPPAPRAPDGRQIAGPGVHGRVMGQSERGEHLGPVASARVELLDARGTAVVNATTNDAGYYAISGLRPGTFVYRVAASGFQTEDSGRGFQLPLSDRPHALDFVVTQGSGRPVAPGELSGRVWSSGAAGKTPLASALVAVRRPDGGPSVGVRTGADGSYRLVLPAADWQAGASADGYAAEKAPRAVGITAGGKAQLDFTLAVGRPPEPLAMTQLYAVVGVEQLPELPDQPPKVAFSSSGRVTATTGAEPEVVVEVLGRLPNNSPRLQQLGLAIDVPAEGDWQWYLARTVRPQPPGNYTAQGELANYHPAKAPPKLALPGLPTVFDLRLERICPEVTVIVQSRDRQPVPGVEVKFVHKTLQRGLDKAVSATTNTGGRATEMIPDGLGTYNVMLTGPGLQPQGREVPITTEKLTLNFQVFKTGEARTIDLAGTVFKKAARATAADTSIKPVSAARLTFQPLAGPARSATSQADGRFQVEGLTEGDYRVAIQATGCFAYAGEVKISFGMDTVSFTMEARNEALENALRALLSEGWGPSGAAAAERYYRAALKEDPKDCRVDYAMALAALSAANTNVAIARLADAIGKREDCVPWDRSCEARLWLLMHLHSTKQAAVEIQAFAQSFYATRPAQPASEDCALTMGVAVAVLKGPWSSDAGAPNGLAVEQAVLAALKDRLRSEFERGRDGVANQAAQLRDAIEQGKQALLAAATEEKRRSDERAAQRMNGIQGDLARLDAQVDALNREARQRITFFEGQMQGFNGQRQQLAAQFQPLVARVNEINMCLGRDRQNYAQVGANPQAAAPVLEEIRDHERELLVINQKLQAAQTQDRQMQASQAALQTQYSREEAGFRNQANTVQATKQALAREYNELRRQLDTPLARKALTSPEIDRLEQQKATFGTYRIFPLEQRRQELLQLLTR